MKGKEVIHISMRCCVRHDEWNPYVWPKWEVAREGLWPA